METRVETCEHAHRGSIKRAHIVGFTGAILAYATLIMSKLTNYPADLLTWNTVAVLPLVVYALLFSGMVWTFARAMKSSRALDDADRQSFGSAQPQR